MKTTWPKDLLTWNEGDVGYMSVPFTWLLPAAKARILQRDFTVSRWIVGGPAVELMPDYLADTPATIGHDLPGVLQRANRYATRTTIGCPNRCQFCAIGRRLIEGEFRELLDWPDGPVICDNNLLAASPQHVERVVDRLVRWGWADFNQGLDARLLTDFHAAQIARIHRPIVRLALDHDAHRDDWAVAVDRLRSAGIRKKSIRSLVLCGYAGTPADDWDRCEFVESHGIPACPMWFHPLDALQHNAITPDQAARGWTPPKQRQLMHWYYQHRGRKPDFSAAR